MNLRSNQVMKVAVGEQGVPVSAPWIEKNAAKTDTGLEQLSNGTAFALLTNNPGADCEVLRRREFRLLGLEGLEDRSLDWYPLDEEEQRFAVEDFIQLPGGIDNPSMQAMQDRFGCEISMGTTGVFEGKKWLAPLMEVYYGSHGTQDDLGTATEAEAMRAARKMANYLAKRVAAIGGKVIEPSLDGDAELVAVATLIPFEWAAKHRDYEHYKKALTELLGFNDKA